MEQSAKLIFIATCVCRKNSAVSGGAIVFNAYFKDQFLANLSSCSSFFDRVDSIINTVLKQNNINISILVDKSESFNLTMIANCTFSCNNATHWNRYGGAIFVRGKTFVRGNSGTKNAETLTAAGCALAKMPVLIQG